MNSITAFINKNQSTIEENITYKQLPFELYELIFSTLRNHEAMNAFSINRFWKAKTIHVIKNRELLKINIFAGILGNHLKDPTLSKFISDHQFNDPSCIELIEKKKNELKNIFSCLPEKDLDNFFDSFKAKKPRLFYELVFLSNKYSKLHDQLNFTLRLIIDADIQDLLKKGAIPSRATLDIALEDRAFFSNATRASVNTIESMLETGAIIPTTEHLNIAINKNSSPLLIAMLDAQAIPNSDHLNLAITRNYLPMMRILLRKGVKPNDFHLYLAEKHSSFEAIMMLLRAGVPPSTSTFNVIERSKIALATNGTLAEFNKLLKPYANGQSPIVAQPVTEPMPEPVADSIFRWILSPIDRLFDF